MGEVGEAEADASLGVGRIFSPSLWPIFDGELDPPGQPTRGCRARAMTAHTLKLHWVLAFKLGVLRGFPGSNSRMFGLPEDLKRDVSCPDMVRLAVLGPRAWRAQNQHLKRGDAIKLRFFSGSLPLPLSPLSSPMAPYFLRNLIPKREKVERTRPLLEVIKTITFIQWCLFFSGLVPRRHLYRNL